MTFVGKVLVIVQVVLSLCFMAFAGAVFTVQQDWKEAYEEKVTQLDQKNQELQEKNEQIAFLNKDLAASQAVQANVQSYLDGLDEFHELAQRPEDDQMKAQLRILATRLQRAERQVSDLQSQIQSKDQILAATSENYQKEKAAKEKAIVEADERAREAKLFKQINKDLTSQVASLQSDLFNLEDKLFNFETDAKTAAEKQKSLLTRVAFLQDVIRRENIDEEEALKKDQPPPLVYGKVLNTKAADRKGPELVEITLGSDDGLDEGHKLSVFRNQGRGKYMGEIRIVHVAADRAVGEVLLKSKNGIIQRGDHVTTKL